MLPRFLVVLCVLSVAGSGGAPAAGPASDATWVEAYAANVRDSDTTESQWWSTAGKIALTDGRLVLTPGRWGAGDAYLFIPRFPGCVRLEMAGSVSPGAGRSNGFFEIRLRANVPVGTHPEVAHAFRLPVGGKAPPLLFRGDKTVTATADPQFRFLSGKSYRIVASQCDARVSLEIDGLPVLTAVDDVQLPRSADNVGFAVQGCSLRIERMSIYARGRGPRAVLRPMGVTGGRPITVKGPAMCARSLAANPDDVDHDVVVFALNDSRFEHWYPASAPDANAAIRFLKKVNERLRYHLVPGPLANRWHADLDYPSRILSVEGVAFERGGKRWIAPHRIEPAAISYPARMLAPDKALVKAGADTLELRVTPTLTVRCVRLPAGRYLQGSPFYEFPRWQDEYPHEVVITRPFYMSETPITQEMFPAVTGKNPSRLLYDALDHRFRHRVPDPGPDFAVENAAWQDIQLFCRLLSERNGRSVRVPTDAEWEYAARVGTSSPCFDEKYRGQRSYVGDSQGRCEPVRRRQPNEWGLYDMIKSGWELVSDYKADNARVKQIDPPGPLRQEAADHGSGPLRRTRGGSFYTDTHPSLHGATNEAGDNEEGLMVFRIVVE